MKKRLLSILLVLILIVTISVPVFAASFSDLKEHWAKEYMEDLAERGYLSGYSNGTMMPDKNITSCETLVLLSRFYDLEDETDEFIYSDYGEYVEDTAPSSISWAYDELALCLAAGIITRDELKNINLSAEIQKEQLVNFVVRAMQLQTEAEKLKDTKLEFKDANDITSDYIGSIAELNTLSIITGDENNNFSPRLSVTRGVVATIISRSLDYLEKEDKSLIIDAYDGLSKTYGIIESASASSVDICGFDGLTREYAVPASASVKVNGAEKSLGSLYEGCYATLLVKKGAVVSMNIDSDDDIEWIQGAIYSITSSTTANILYITDLESGEETKYTIPSSADITKDGKTVAFSSLDKNSFVTLELEDEKVTELSSTSGDGELEGDITEISYGAIVTLKIKDSSDTVFSFAMDISNLPSILRGEIAISLDRLNIGDNVKLALESCAVESIVAVGTENIMTGELTSITTTADGTTWIIKAENGTNTTLSVDQSAGVYNGDNTILLSAIKVGDTVSVIVYGTTITEIHLESSASSASKVSGTVLDVSTTNKMITILTSSDKLVYVSTSSASSIITASTGSTLKLSSITVNSQLVAYGTYSSSTAFAAKSIIIEN